MSIPSTAAKGLKARRSSLIVVEAGKVGGSTWGASGVDKKTLEVVALTYQASQLGSWAYSRICCVQKHSSRSHS